MERECPHNNGTLCDGCSRSPALVHRDLKPQNCLVDQFWYAQPHLARAPRTPPFFKNTPADPRIARCFF